MSTWFITGSSAGLGRDLARAVLGAGHHAVVTARDPDRVADLVAEFPGTALALRLDVTDGEQVVEAVALAEERFGGIDVLVNNAGYGYRAAIEEGEPAAIQRLFETHVFGPAALIRAVLPGMRARRSGTIVNLSSLAAHAFPAGSGYYASAKAAVDGLSGALRREVAPLGIRVIVIAPGRFRTDFAGRSLTQSVDSIADYAATAGARRIEAGTGYDTEPGDPARAAAAIIAAVEAERPPVLLMLGTDALDGARDLIAKRLVDFERWEQVSRGTDYPA